MLIISLIIIRRRSYLREKRLLHDTTFKSFTSAFTGIGGGGGSEDEDGNKEKLLKTKEKKGCLRSLWPFSKKCDSKNDDNQSVTDVDENQKVCV